MRATAPDLVAVDGVGIDTAAILLVAAGDNPQRLRSEAALGAPVWRRSDRSVLGQDRPSSSQPRREPTSEPCVVADRVHPHERRRAYPRLRRTTRSMKDDRSPRSSASSSVTSPARSTSISDATKPRSRWRDWPDNCLTPTRLSFERSAGPSPEPSRSATHGLIRACPQHEWPITGLPAPPKRPLTTHRSIDPRPSKVTRNRSERAHRTRRGDH